MIFLTLVLLLPLGRFANGNPELESTSQWLRRVQLTATSLRPPCCDPLLQPGTNGNNICKEGSACCPDGTWACSIGDGVTFPCGGELIVNPNGLVCGEKCCEFIDKPCKGVRCCPDGIWTCPNADGSYTCGGTEVANPTGKACPRCCDKLFMPLCFIGTAGCCPDGTWACPDGATGTYPCEPIKDPQGTTCDTPCCDPLLEPGGPIVTEPCEFGHVCDPKGIWQCLGRPMPTSNPAALPNVRKLQLQVAAAGKVCDKPCCDPTIDLRCLIGNPACCPNGQWTCPDGLTGLYPCSWANPEGPMCDNGCCEPEAAPDCGTLKPVCCPEGSWTCPAKGGGYVCRDQAFVEPPGGTVCNECCPNKGQISCLTGVASCCSDGTWMCPDAYTGLYKCGGAVVKELAGKACEACCDPAMKPPGPFPCRGEGLACCSDGTWACSIGDGKTFPCGGELVVEPQGKVCNTTVTPTNCCEPSEMLFCLIGNAGCCPDGTWACPNGVSGPYRCGDVEVDKTTGAVCACCDPAKEPGANGNPLCIEGHACCPDGTWSCSIGDGVTFSCGGVATVNPQGNACNTSVTLTNCCEPSEMLFCLIGSAGCCPDGTWACPNGENGPYLCGDVKVDKPTGTVCACCDPAREPGANGNPLCFEGHACCPDGTWSCSIGDGVTFPCGGVDTVNPQGKVCNTTVTPTKCCEPSEMLLPCPTGGNAGCCPDGSWVCPNTVNGRFLCGDVMVKDPAGTICSCCDPALKPPGPFPCRGEGLACCPDGTWSCSIGDGKTFPCGGELVVEPQGNVCPVKGCCEKEAAPDCGGLKPGCCSDGSWTCPGKDAGYICSNQAFLGPPDGKVCDKCCPSQELISCAVGKVSCCSDGTWVCPDSASGLYMCGDVLVKETNGKACEGCCDPAQKPPAFSCKGEGIACCPDGTWSCSIGDGKTFVCGGQQVEKPQGKVCACCDPDKAPPCLIGKAGCCKDGSWACPNGENGPYTCGGVVVDEPPGTLCGCCDPAKAPKGCFEGIACCPDGTWSCSIGDAMTYPCGGSLLINPTGKICKCCDRASEPGMFGNPICREGHACCPDGTWSCSIGDGKTFPCGNVNIVNPNGAICQGVVDTGGGDPWTYTVPVWFPDVARRFAGDNLQKCKKRRFAPKDGARCGLKSKTCFFGLQDCAGSGPQPDVKCECNGDGLTKGNWTCTPEACPGLPK